MPTITTAEATLYYEEYGAGPPLIFLHGRSGNTLVWWQQIEAFAHSYRCILVDQRGWGRSGGVLPEPWADAFVPDLDAVLAALGVSEFAVVAQSMGGITANVFCGRYPGRVQAAVLCGTTGGFVPPAVQSLYYTAMTLADEQRAGWTGDSLAHPALGAHLYREQPNLARLYVMLSALNAPPRIAPDAGPPGPHEHQWHLPPHTLLIYGEEDALYPPEIVEAVAAEVPGCTALPVARTGHSVYFERPELFNDAVAAFLREHFQAQA